jgi:hypothetical protein
MIDSYTVWLMFLYTRKNIDAPGPQKFRHQQTILDGPLLEQTSVFPSDQKPDILLVHSEILTPPPTSLDIYCYKYYYYYYYCYYSLQSYT